MKKIKEIIVNKSAIEVKEYLNNLPKIELFELETVSEALGKYVFKYDIYKIEIVVENISDTQTKLSTYVLIGKQYLGTEASSAQTVITNFENGFNLIIEGKHEDFVKVKESVGQIALNLIITIVCITMFIIAGIFFFQSC